MNATDREGIRRRGSAAYIAGVESDDNPFYAYTLPFEDWIDICLAWADGSLREDARLDEAMRVRMRVRYW